MHLHILALFYSCLRLEIKTDTKLYHDASFDLFAMWMILHDLVTQMVDVDMRVNFCGQD